MSEIKSKRLSEVINYIKTLVDSQLANKRFWLKTEISNINFHTSGHCYIDFVENQNGTTIAQCRASIWSSNIPQIRSELGTDFNNILKKGGEILCLVEVTFSTIHGLSLTISSIDKYFALGELEKKKRETYKRLQTENLLEKNKVFVLPAVIQKIAVVGSQGTSGHTDFLKQLEKNEFGYIFNVIPFQCQVQGDKAEHEIIQRLDQLKTSDFDIVVLIRGGGSKLDLEVFNSYEIAKRIALHTKPVLTGIGHETDISIVDLVANQYYKTPSALGAFIVARNHHFEITVQNSYNRISTVYQSYIQKQNHRLQQCTTEFRTRAISFTQLRRGKLHQTGNRISTIIKEKVGKQKQFVTSATQTIQYSTTASIDKKQKRLVEISTLLSLQSKQTIKTHGDKLNRPKEFIQHYAKTKFTKEKNFLLNCSELIALYHPDNVLDRGYSITRINGSIIDKSATIKKGDQFETELIDKIITASVISVKPKISKWKTLLMKVQQKS